ncbi:ArnT family glycosyltransferase [Dictyobacter arantiisoli]|uniref:Glycosyltransferase RgtA/B/C/D-like domain-containing protein n=1 Tax=Dictyobacter arantiisoli TaxID=2014874 RepID=A0A5A5TB94_9CHLR|nr:glycosyltransferase family 39 protein [Dictyobacter arantiisoli]GCF08627.1 hypothetical protein KDI_21910 [Dictyobacter arantiisoli]
MNVDTQKNFVATAPHQEQSGRFSSLLRMLLNSWEIYAILLIAAFLRLYRISTTEFDADQANIFAMAYNAVSHGHLVATSNIASIGIINPPAIIYALMIPAAFSANPIGGAILTALLAIAAILLTYIMTRRYYGRLAGTLTALLYTFASVPIFYARFMWNQNMLLFFVPLLFWFLYRGVVARRSNWLFPSVILLALLLQFHASSIVLAASIIVAWLLAPRKTWHWYDIVLSLVGILVLYSSYILWLFHSHFQDIHILLSTSSHKVLIDAQALFFYLQLLGPFSSPPAYNPHAILYPYWSAFTWIEPVMTLLLVGGILLMMFRIIWSPVAIRTQHTRRTVVGSLLRWWSELRASPERCGYCILLSWQIIPLLYLTRHNIVLHEHYFIMFMPGPFMLVGIFVAKIVDWTRRQGRISGKAVLRWGVLALSLVLILAQGVTGWGYVFDLTHGNFDDAYNVGSYYNDLATLQQTLTQAEQLAQQHHFNHIYVSADLATFDMYQYLVGHTKISTSVFADSCMVLPGVESGGAILLATPHNHWTTLAVHLDQATQLATLPHPGGPSFSFYALHPLVATQNASDNYNQEVKFMGVQSLPNGSQSTAVTRWQMLRSAQPGYHTVYNYVFKRSTQGTNTALARRQCSFDSLRAGDQILAPLGNITGMASILQVSNYTTLPVTMNRTILGMFPLQIDTYKQYDTVNNVLKDTKGANHIPLTPSRPKVSPQRG